MVRGADFSSYQDAADLERALGEGIRFAFVKLTEGATYASPAARTQLDTLRAHGVRCGVYHYLDAGAVVGAQWQHFANALETIPYWRELIVALDYEAPGATDAQAAAFIAAGKRDGFRVGLYSSARTHAYANVKPAFRWIAAWRSPSSTKPPREATFWQWAPGINGAPDWDVFVGTLAGLGSFWKAHAGRAARYFARIAGAPAVELGPYRSWVRAGAAGAAYMVRHPARPSFRVDRVT